MWLWENKFHLEEAVQSLEARGVMGLGSFFTHDDTTSYGYIRDRNLLVDDMRSS